jgi:hypothetical protein
MPRRQGKLQDKLDKKTHLGHTQKPHQRNHIFAGFRSANNSVEDCKLLQ